MDRYITARDDRVKYFFMQSNDAVSQLEELIRSSKPLLNGHRFLTDLQLSQRLGISRRTLQDYRDRGLIAFYRLDGKILYDENDVDRFLLDSYRPRYLD